MWKGTHFKKPTPDLKDKKFLELNDMKKTRGSRGGWTRVKKVRKQSEFSLDIDVVESQEVCQKKVKTPELTLRRAFSKLVKGKASKKSLKSYVVKKVADRHAPHRP